jgi:predicted alpha/beta-fold hydrolase
MEVDGYSPPYFLFNQHLETIYPALFRRVNVDGFRRERISTPDDDFLDIDWLDQPTTSLPTHVGNPAFEGGVARINLAMTDGVVIISHGLEGNSQRPYMKGMAKAFFNAGYNVITWNYRGCGDEMNRRLRFYHSGATDDLDVVVKHVSSKFKSIYLVGFSLGGNITLKYLGEGERGIKGAVVFSVPLNLKTSCEKIGPVYANRFLRSLKKKVIAKSRLMDGLDISGIDRISTLKDFDDRYTAPLHGFKDALHYYQSCSSLYFLKDIRVPTLITNAKNDPFLGADCYPTHIDNPSVQFDFPQHGGHVGFSLLNNNNLYWSELRALQFIQKIK